MIILFLLLVPLAETLEIKGQFNDPKQIQDVLDSLPKECKKNGQTYKEGEKFEIGRLRYQCQKYGVYSIEGCRTEKNESMAIGETTVKDNIAHQCLAAGNSVYYRETMCGILGQPACDKVPKPTGYEENAKKEQPKGKEITIAGLPKGWKILEEGARKIPGTNATIISRTLIFSPTDHQRARRQTGHGVGRVIGMEDVGTDKPPMPMEMLMGGKKVTSAPKEGGSEPHKASSGGHPAHFTLMKDKTRVTQTQTLGQTLNIVGKKDTRETNYKPGSVGGSRSDVNWHGKTISVNGKQIAAGPGTFTFGTSPTGVFLKKEGSH